MQTNKFFLIPRYEGKPHLKFTVVPEALRLQLLKDSIKQNVLPGTAIITGESISLKSDANYSITSLGSRYLSKALLIELKEEIAKKNSQSAHMKHFVEWYMFAKMCPQNRLHNFLTHAASVFPSVYPFSTNKPQ